MEIEVKQAEIKIIDLNKENDVSEAKVKNLEKENTEQKKNIEELNEKVISTGLEM